MKVAWLTKRHYSQRDLLTDRFGRLFHLPTQLAALGNPNKVWAADYPGGRSDFLTVGDCEFLSFKAPLKGVEVLSPAQFKAIRKFSPDVLIASGHTHLLAVGKLLAKLLRRPFIAEVYDYYPAFHKGQFPGDKLLFRQLIKHADAAIFASNALDRSFGSLCPRSIVLPNVIDQEIFQPLNRKQCRAELDLGTDEKVVVFAGGLHLDRGLADLLDAMKLVSNRLPSLHLILAGSPEPILSELPYKITYLGSLTQPHLSRLLNAADLACAVYSRNQLTRYINSCKLNEYLSVGVPVVASDVGDASDVLGINHPGLCPPGNSEALAQAIEQQLKNPAPPVNASIPTWQELSRNLEDFLRDSLNKSKTEAEQ